MDGELRASFRKHLPDGFFQSIESGGIGKGIPDSYYCFKGGLNGWCEMKRATANAVKIDAMQVAWIEKHCRFGGRTFVAVRQHAPKGPRREAYDKLWMIHGTGARWLLDGGLKAVPGELVHGIYDNGPANWDWDDVRAILTQ